jgi:hypothetical protein
LNLNKRKYAFEIRKCIIETTLWTAGPILKNCKGSFAKGAAEGVSLDLGRRISFRQPRLDRGGERGVGRPELEPNPAAPWPDLVGACGLSDLGH